jgi:hypothetical protein
MLVLVSHVRETGCWASGRDLGARWVKVFGLAVPADVSGRWTRIFERAIADGRVLVQTAGRTQTYAPRELASGLADHVGSDLMRVEQAIERLEERLGGAVPVETIQAEIASDPALAMRTSATSVASRVLRLAEQQRIQRMHAPGSTNERWYYAPLGAKARVAPEAELELDRRMRTIRALWRSADGRPFTTRAVSQYAVSRDTFAIHEDTVYGWTNALQHLARQGFLTRLDSAQGEWHVRWALTAEWEVLSAEEQAARLVDPYGRDAAPLTAELSLALCTSTTAGALGTPDVMIAKETHDVAALIQAVHLAPTLPGVRVDVGTISRARDVASLVAHAQHRVAQELTNDGVMVDFVARPVTLNEIEQASTQRPVLLARKESLTTAVHEATRIRAGMKQAAVTHLGTVRNVAYFSVRPSREATAFVAVQAVMAEADVDRLNRVASTLQGDCDYSAGGIVPVPSTLLYARAAVLHAEADELAARLEAALSDAPLTLDERGECDSTLHGLREIAAHASRIKAAHRQHAERAGDIAGAHRPPPSVWLDVEVAERQFRGLREYAMESPRALWARFSNAVRVFRRGVDDVVTDGGGDGGATGGADGVAGGDPREMGDIAPQVGDGAARSRGRRAKNYLDRVGFSMWIARRDGGPLLSGMAAQAASVIGEWRYVELVISALADPGCFPAHAGLCAALGFFDDPDARDALARYLVSVMREVPVPTHGADAGVCESAEDEWSRPVWRVPSAQPGAHLPQPSSNAVATAALALGRTPCGGMATALQPHERHALELVRNQLTTSFAGQAASQVLRGWDSAWTREQWLGL